VYYRLKTHVKKLAMVKAVAVNRARSARAIDRADNSSTIVVRHLPFTGPIKWILPAIYEGAIRSGLARRGLRSSRCANRPLTGEDGRQVVWPRPALKILGCSGAEIIDHYRRWRRVHHSN